MQIVESFMFNDQLFNLDNVRSLECFKNKGLESNFLTRSDLRLTVPFMTAPMCAPYGGFAIGGLTFWVKT